MHKGEDANRERDEQREAKDETREEAELLQDGEEPTNEEGLEVSATLSLVRVEAHADGSEAAQDAHRKDHPGVLLGGVQKAPRLEFVDHHLCLRKLINYKF